MDQLTFQKVESLFEEAVGLDSSTRRLFLERVAQEHTREICVLLCSLLACDISQTRWTRLGTPFDGVLPSLDPEPAGTVIGRFRLVERLGFGGHGEVYLAEQIEPVQRRVALKMVRVGEDSAAAIARFRTEQQALAMMNHPGIAAVYEAGLADRGRMYFAMEYVDGQPIDVYCDQRRLTVPQRLRLMLDASQAVQHAHQKGVIHRDLKPSNILVTERDGRATPVLIDFGISVATASVERAGDSVPGAIQAIGTPAYMSPEQAGTTPGDLDTRSDVYALGILLYEALTGRTPLDVLMAPGATIAAIRRCITDQVAPAPASLLAQRDDAASLAATRRRCTVSQLQRQVRGDLDAIVCKAIARDRADRYQTVEALSRDIENHLNHRPISVGATGTIARARKFVRRHRLAVAAGLAIAATIAVGLIATTVAMLRAERSARESQAINSFLRDLLTSSRPLEKGATVPFVDVLRGGSTMAADRFSAHPNQEGEVRYLIGHTHYTLGLYREARTELERSVSLLRASLGLKHPTTLHAMSLLAMVAIAQHRLDEAETLAREIVTHTIGEPIPLRERYLAAERVLCDIASERGNNVEAEQRLRALIPQIDAELGTTHIEGYNARMTLVQVLRRQKKAGHDESGIKSDYDEEVRLLRETIAHQQARFGTEDAYPLLAAKVKLAQIFMEQRRFADAEPIVQPLLSIVHDRFGAAHWMYGHIAIALAEIKYARGDHAAAADDYSEAVRSLRLGHPPNHPNVLAVMRDLLPYLDAAGRAEDGLHEAQDLHERLAAILGPDNLITLEARAWMGRFSSLAGQLDEATAHFAALEPHADVLYEDATGGYVMLFHAGHLARLGRFEEAEAELLHLAERQQGVTSGVNSAHPDDMARMFVEVYTLSGRPDKAREYQEVAQSILRSAN